MVTNILLKVCLEKMEHFESVTSISLGLDVIYTKRLLKVLMVLKLTLIYYDKNK